MFGRRTPSVMVPDAVPVLSRGSHRNPRRGACFMEMASYLAGESWSDHPACTHPALASLARLVNDTLEDEWRQQIALLIPEVVGLNPQDGRVAAVVLRRAALAAMPVTWEERAGIMGMAVLTSEQALRGLDAQPRWTVLSTEARTAFEQTPSALAWARAYIARTGLEPRAIRDNEVGRILHFAVDGIARSVAADASQRLLDLLATAIADVQALMPSEAAAPVTVAPVPALLTRDMLPAH